MASILAFTAGEPFDPQAVGIMSSALDKAWRLLVATGSFHAADVNAEKTRATLAESIIGAARDGNRNATQLSGQALIHLQATTPEPVAGTQ